MLQHLFQSCTQHRVSFLKIVIIVPWRKKNEESALNMLRYRAKKFADWKCLVPIKQIWIFFSLIMEMGYLRDLCYLADSHTVNIYEGRNKIKEQVMGRTRNSHQ